jgi:hypothetical protein
MLHCQTPKSKWLIVLAIGALLPSWYYSYPANLQQAKMIVWSFRPGPGGYDHIFSPRTSPRSLQIRPAMSDRRLMWTKDEHSLLIKIRRELPQAKLEDLTDAFNKNNQKNTQRNKGERTPIAVRTKLRSLGLSNRSKCWCRKIFLSLSS